jgi:hypothetical protein
MSALLQVSSKIILRKMQCDENRVGFLLSVRFKRDKCFFFWVDVFTDFPTCPDYISLEFVPIYCFCSLHGNLVLNKICCGKIPCSDSKHYMYLIFRNICVLNMQSLVRLSGGESESCRQGALGLVLLLPGV